jgi:transmembrane sensor
MYYKVIEDAAELIVCIRYMLQSPEHLSALLLAFLLFYGQKMRAAFRSDEQGAALRPFGKAVLPRLVLAGVFVVALTLVLIHLSAPNGTGERAGNLVCTGVGEVRNLHPEDGLTIELTTRTCVVVLVSATKREVDLLHGEALFTVRHNEMRPFTVLTPKLAIEDLGTEFRVYEHEGETNVGVLQGEVGMRARSAPPSANRPLVRLGPGERATAVSTPNAVAIKLEKSSRRDLERMLAWREGALELGNNSTLKDFVFEFNRYNVRQLMIVDPTIENLPVGGHFRYSDLDEAIKAVTHLHGIHVSVDESNPNILRLSGP